MAESRDSTTEGCDHAVMRRSRRGARTVATAVRMKRRQQEPASDAGEEDAGNEPGHENGQRERLHAADERDGRECRADASAGALDGVCPGERASLRCRRVQRPSGTRRRAPAMPAARTRQARGSGLRTAGMRRGRRRARGGWRGPPPLRQGGRRRWQRAATTTGRVSPRHGAAAMRNRRRRRSATPPAPRRRRVRRRRRRRSTRAAGRPGRGVRAGRRGRGAWRPQIT